MYASGKTVTEINRYLNEKHIKTSHGNGFNKNSLHRLLRNKWNIGYYIYNGKEVPDAMPRIIDDELFNRVQRILDRNKKAPARARAKEEYLLTTKLFCGYCREMMVGYSGTSSTGNMYHYYICKKARRKQCKKKIVNKQAIEYRVVSECRKLLTDSNIKKISEAVAAACKADYDNTEEKRIKRLIKETDKAIENLWKALEHGQAVDMITERIKMKEKEKKELQGQLAIEISKHVILTEPQIKAFLYSLKRGKFNGERNRKGIINIFLNAVYLWDDKLTMILNGGDKPITIDDILLDEIEADNKAFVSSSMVAEAPPWK